MHIGRSIAPSAAPFDSHTLFSGLRGLRRREQEVRILTDSLCAYFRVEHCFPVSSGKAALTLILQALSGIHPDRKDVLIPAFTCYSVPASIARAGLQVKLCDINPQTLDFDEAALSSLLTGPWSAPTKAEQTKTHNTSPLWNDSDLLAIIPTHLFGLPAETTWGLTQSNSRGPFLVEDAAQAIGAGPQTKRLGTQGDVSFFSLGRGKSLSTVEGGIILTNNKKISLAIQHCIRKLPDYPYTALAKLIVEWFALRVLLEPNLFWIPKALPFLKLGETIYDPQFAIHPMSGFQAGLARRWPSTLRQFKAKRKRNIRYWRENITNEGLQHFCRLEESLPDLIRYPLLIDDTFLRQRLLNTSETLGLGIMPGYPKTINWIHEIHSLFIDKRFPGAERVAQSLVTLPVHPLLTHRDRKRILSAFRSCQIK